MLLLPQARSLRLGREGKLSFSLSSREKYGRCGVEKCDFLVVYIPENPFGIKELVQVNGSACIQGQSQKRHQPVTRYMGMGIRVVSRSVIWKILW